MPLRRTPQERARRARLADAAAGAEHDPEPAAGCDVCVALDRQRKEAQWSGDFSRVVDCNVELRRHPHGGRP
ncbi:hypothetical protein [Streptomyces luteireticuli]|uniref:Uncharacterized protein n=1 Tax=Streptomyces luteireticuli TaxID=173858 RepID=A0ABN0YA66_9ACTN